MFYTIKRTDSVKKLESVTFLYNSEKYHSDGVYRQISKEMHEPRYPYPFAFYVKNVEKQSAEEKRRNYKNKKPRSKPTAHNSHVIEAKCGRAEQHRKFNGGKFSQYQKREASEEKFLEQGIAK